MCQFQGNIFSRRDTMIKLLLFAFCLTFPSPSCQKRILRTFDPCYDDEGNPQWCRPEFQNIALKKSVRVSESCGTSKPETFCRLLNRGGRVVRTCDSCEREGANSHPASFLTDINDMGNITYWQSKPFQNRNKRDPVTLIIPFEKRFELSYISLQFYSPRPAAMVIYKSMNHRKTWIPYQFYARSCPIRFGLADRASTNITNEQEALCSEIYSNPLPLSGGRVLFNPVKGRPSEGDFDNSHILQDWVTATDIKIVLTGVNDVSGVVPFFGYNKRRSVGSSNRSRVRKNLLPPATSENDARSIRDDRLRDTFSPYRKGSRRSIHTNADQPTRLHQYGFGANAFYAINDVTIGGRCKCNGHASTCSVKNNRLVCDCRHNTAGVNCERCKAFHFDRPWKRATRTNANTCIACNCNLHAKKCRFNADLFMKSGGVSGGVCQRCRHHTTGRFCHLCKPGYYKNPRVSSIAHRKVCKTCGCHPVGAAGSICDAITGQCPCKDGVAGKKCNRCAKGYQQTKSRVAPCIKIPVVQPSDIQACSSTCKRSRAIQLTVSKWCDFDYVLEAEVAELITSGKWTRITLKINRAYKRGNASLRRGLHEMQIRERSYRCLCLNLKKNRKYLLLGNNSSDGEHSQLMLNKDTVALRWRNKYKRKLFGLVQRTRSLTSC